MSGIYYTDLLDILRAAGCQVGENSITDGWQNRARSSGGFPADPFCVFWHHTASNTSPSNDLSYMIDGSDDAPIGNMLIDRDGVCWPIAAGASNCAGKGGPMTFSRGVVSVDSGNTKGWNIEVANAGTGQPWPQVQVNAFFAASNALNARFGNQPTDITSHALGAGDGYTDRKIDPATASGVEGPWQPASVNSSGTWSLADMRAECLARAAGPPPPDPEEFDLSQQQYDEIMSAIAYVRGQCDNIAVNIYGNPDGVNPPYNASVWGRVDTVSRQVDEVRGQVVAALSTLWGNTDNPPYHLSVNGMLIQIEALLGFNPWEVPASDAQVLSVEAPPAGEPQTPPPTEEDKQR